MTPGLQDVLNGLEELDQGSLRGVSLNGSLIPLQLVVLLLPLILELLFLSKEVLVFLVET